VGGRGTRARLRVREGLWGEAGHAGVGKFGGQAHALGCARACGCVVVEGDDVDAVGAEGFAAFEEDVLEGVGGEDDGVDVEGVDGVFGVEDGEPPGVLIGSGGIVEEGDDGEVHVEEAFEAAGVGAGAVDGDAVCAVVGEGADDGGDVVGERGEEAEVFDDGEASGAPLCDERGVGGCVAPGDDEGVGVWSGGAGCDVAAAHACEDAASVAFGGARVVECFPAPEAVV